MIRRPIQGISILNLFLCLCVLPVFAQSAAEIGGGVAAGQLEQYGAQIPKSIIELQQFRQTESVRIPGGDGKSATAVLINLNPKINIWYLLRLNLNDGGPESVYHLENPYPKQQIFGLDESHPDGLVMVSGGNKADCQLWASASQPAIDHARRSQLIYAPLCGGKLYLRNPTKGHRTKIEVATDFLRDKVPGGEAIIGFVKGTFYKDAYLKEGLVNAGTSTTDETESPDLPKAALIDPNRREQRMVPTDLGVSLKRHLSGGVTPGRWYAVEENSGIYISLIQPNLIDPEVLKSHASIVKNLDTVEKTALVYLIAFDLDRFDVGFDAGTEHPRVDWSERVPDQMKNAGLPGPDGIGSIAPLVAAGLISPVNGVRIAATFTGGFKRSHGAFKFGELAYKNNGSHYGFIQNGVVFSKLQPGLSTLYVLADGTVDMQTWRESDDMQLPQIAHARQNGVPIIEVDPATQQSVPGRLVGQWGPGNWSGSKNEMQRTLRAGVALQEKEKKRFLIYGYFSSATPSAMARVFQAYGCRYAMHLDMNALEHTYLAVYRREGGNLIVQHLIQEMNVLDKNEKGRYVPRFLGYPDNRDFFYLMRKANR